MLGVLVGVLVVCGVIGWQKKAEFFYFFAFDDYGFSQYCLHKLVYMEDHELETIRNSINEDLYSNNKFSIEKSLSVISCFASLEDNYFSRIKELTNHKDDYIRSMAFSALTMFEGHSPKQTESDILPLLLKGLKDSQSPKVSSIQSLGILIRRRKLGTKHIIYLENAQKDKNATVRDYANSYLKLAKRAP